MKALVLRTAGHVSLEDIEQEPIPVGYARVRLLAAALNHRDVWIIEGKYAKIRYPSVLGSDGCGIVEEVNDAERSLIGQRVIINPNQHWGADERVQSADYTILGMPSPGTFAEYITVPLDRLHPAPAHLGDEEAAALPLAGLTAYRAVAVQGQVGSSDALLISGIGGGVALFALLFARALGARTIAVTSGAAWKLERAIALGADHGVLYTAPTWSDELRRRVGGFDLIVDGSAGEPFNHLVALSNPAGRIVLYGATLGGVPMLDVHRIFWRQLRIIGTTMGSDRDFAAMLAAVEQYQIRPVVDSVFPLAQYAEAFERMRRGEQFGKIVLRISA
ncbi:MAG: alcohol dehydrogenase [Candidatus Kapaibacterium sp.]|nr:MAG: alcohol dehydrogenase [Candidatus Kapabacteria bacterium]